VGVVVSAVSQGAGRYRRLFGSQQRDAQHFDRGSLPTPARYLRDRGLCAGKVRGEWTSIRCPAHKSGAEAHPSLRVSLFDGHFRCMTCGAKGGDIIALHRLLTGCGFVQALRDLGARLHE
jgi:hypothetical protein